MNKNQGTKIMYTVPCKESSYFLHINLSLPSKSINSNWLAFAYEHSMVKSVTADPIDLPEQF